MRNATFMAMAFVAVGCIQDRYTEITPDGNVEVTTPTGIDIDDANGDEVPDAEQSVGEGVDDNGEPFLVFFASNPYLPSYRSYLEWIGFGCSARDNRPDDDWVNPCAPLGTMSLNGTVIGYTVTGIPEDVPFEGVPIDVAHNVWTNAALSQRSGDETDFFVRHVDFDNCSIEQQENATHFAYIRIDDLIVGLGESIAPPNRDCSY
jgi:hypothetical protein